MFSDKKPVKKLKYNKNKKSRADVLEQKLFKIVFAAFVLILAFVGIHLFLNRELIATNTSHYMTLTQAEKGTKDMYGATKDAAGNVTNLNNLRGISCYGDSYTNAPDDATSSYPGVLSYLAQRTVYNIAVDNDSIFETAARQGGSPAYVSPFVIPANKSSTEVLVSDKDGRAINFDYSKNGGLNPCSINGVEGLLSVIDGRYVFTRTESGDETLVLTPAEVKSRAMLQRMDDVSVFFVGDDAIFKTPEKAVEIYKKMADSLNEKDRAFIVVGPIKGEVAVLEAANKALAEAFGDNFFNLRQYLLTDAAEDIKITLSEDDRVLAQNGIIPYVYFSNNKYFSAEGADAAAFAIYNKLNELNYLTDGENEQK